MKTAILKPNSQTYEVAKKIIESGELVAFPTETVYGLGANALNDEAVKKIFVAKGRPSDNPLILHVGKKSDIIKYAKTINETQQKLIKHFMPGPISIIFDKADCVSSVACANGNTVAIRLPENKIAQKFINACNLPICAPSANTSKRPSPTRASHVYDDLNGKIELIIDGGETKVGIESTVVKVENDVIYILRAGKINKKMLHKKTGKLVVDKIDTAQIPESPGTKYTHYKPKCNMILVKNNMINNVLNLYDNYKNNSHSPIILCKRENKKYYYNKNVIVLGKDSVEASHNLFNYLRKIENSYDVIIAEYFSNGEMVDGLYNRMIKASGGQII